MEINCNKCNSHLFTTSQEDMVQVGIEAMGKGFVYKNAILFTGVDTKLFFCNKACSKEYYSLKIPKDEGINEVLEGLRKSIPDMSKEICNKMDVLTKALRKK